MGKLKFVDLDVDLYLNQKSLADNKSSDIHLFEWSGGVLYDCPSRLDDIFGHLFAQELRDFKQQAKALLKHLYVMLQEHNSDNDKKCCMCGNSYVHSVINGIHLEIVNPRRIYNYSLGDDVIEMIYDNLEGKHLCESCTTKLVSFVGTKLEPTLHRWNNAPELSIYDIKL